MKKTIFLAAFAALVGFCPSAFAAQSAALNGGKITMECADGLFIRTVENDPSIWIFSQKWECKYHSTKTLFQIFEEKMEKFSK